MFLELYMYGQLGYMSDMTFMYNRPNGHTWRTWWQTFTQHECSSTVMSSSWYCCIHDAVRFFNVIPPLQLARIVVCVREGRRGGGEEGRGEGVTCIVDNSSAVVLNYKSCVCLGGGLPLVGEGGCACVFLDYINYCTCCTDLQGNLKPTFINSVTH